MARQIFITGISSGIGAALARACLERGDQVYGISRRTPDWQPHSNHAEDLHFARQDITDFETLPQTLATLLKGVKKLDLLLLNAGVLGEIRDLHDTPLEEIQRVMTVNTWANKVLLDSLFDQGVAMEQVVGMSSGAAVSGSRGWNAYALSKASFKMLLQLYAAEWPETHFCSFAPGLVDTAMQDYLCDLSAEDCQTYPSLGRIQSVRGTKAMPTPDELAPTLLECFPQIRSEPSGSFIDIRNFSN
ncbi:MAG: SDR family NAD(P)-dependent oxidoreductase [Deltaproteobacteria bacterium]|nr:SDR family NAD(P)-dependent oxidoreductase [Deltaproteobacteria bacterium]